MAAATQLRHSTNGCNIMFLPLRNLTRGALLQEGTGAKEFVWVVFLFFMLPPHLSYSHLGAKVMYELQAFVYV